MKSLIALVTLFFSVSCSPHSVSGLKNNGGHQEYPTGPNLIGSYEVPLNRLWSKGILELFDHNLEDGSKWDASVYSLSCYETDKKYVLEIYYSGIEELILFNLEGKRTKTILGLDNIKRFMEKYPREVRTPYCPRKSEEKEIIPLIRRGLQRA